MGIRVYDLRHTAASNMIVAGVDLVTVAEMTGHSVQVLVSTHAHYVEEAGRRAADTLTHTSPRCARRDWPRSWQPLGYERGLTNGALPSRP